MPMEKPARVMSYALAVSTWEEEGTEREGERGCYLGTADDVQEW